MALTVPDLDDLKLFSGQDWPTDEHEYVENVLFQATDVIWVFTGFNDDPSDARTNRIVQYAIMDLSLWLMTQAAHRDEINSPFSSERIGSYSYSKMQGAQKGEDTGIYWVDMLFRLLRAPSEEYSLSWVDSERVFNPTGETFEEMETKRTGSDGWPIAPETPVHLPTYIDGGTP